MTTLYKLYRYTMIGVLSLSLATVSMVSPARAGDDTARFVAGLIGLAVIGAAISEMEKDRNRAGHPPPVVVHPEDRRRNPQRPHITPRPLPEDLRAHTLPLRCVPSDGVGQGGNALLAKRCLKRHYRNADRLPGKCEVRYWNQKRADVRKGYTLNCLERHGFRLARH